MTPICPAVARPTFGGMANKKKDSGVGEDVEKVINPGKLTKTEKKKLGWIVVGPFLANYLGSMAAIGLARWIWRKIDGQNPPQPSQTTGFIANALCGFGTR